MPLMARIGLTDSDLFGGYLVEPDELVARGLRAATGVPRMPPRDPPKIPLETVEQPQFGRGKQTTAADLASLFSAIHLAARGRGPLIDEFRGAITPAEVRHLLFLLAHTRNHDTRLAQRVPRATVAHKAGWISNARHDARHRVLGRWGVRGRGHDVQRERRGRVERPACGTGSENEPRRVPHRQPRTA